MLRILLFLLLPITLFSQTKNVDLKIDTTGKVSICLGDSVITKIFLENLRFNRWVVIDSIDTRKKGYDTCYFSHVELLTLRNNFRVSTFSPEQKKRVISSDSYVVEKKLNNDSCSRIDNYRPTTLINFKCEVQWEVYDQYGNMVKKGFGKTIDVSSLPKGGYFLNTPYSSMEFLKQ